MTKGWVGEVLAIGDEIVCGKLLDTNSQWISQQLGELGVAVRYHSSIGDRLEDYRVALEVAAGRSDVIVCSGGLGPTEDDLTSASLADFSGVEMEFDETSWKQICSIFAQRNRPIAPKNRKQALRPAGSRAIANPNGTAPGIDFLLPERSGRRARLFALPGVPAELREMWGYVANEIKKLVGPRIFFQYTLNCFGAGESDVEAMIPPEIMRRGRNPLVGITASQATISLRVSTTGPSIEECRQTTKPTIDQLRNVLGVLVYGEQDEPMESVVVRRMNELGKSMVIVDMGSAGLLYQRLREFDVSGQRIVGGFQGNEASISKYFPDAAMPVDWTADNLLHLAAKARQILESDWGLAIGPLPDSSAAQQVFRIAISDGRKNWTPEISCAAHPAIRLARAYKGILNVLRLNILG